MQWNAVERAIKTETEKCRIKKSGQARLVYVKDIQLQCPHHVMVTPWALVVVIAVIIVSWCFEPSQPHRITSGLNTDFTLSPSYSFHKSSYHKSWVFFFLAYLYSVGTQHGNPHPAGWPILFCRPTKEPCVSHSKHRKKSGEILEKKCRWIDRKCRNKQEIPGSKCSMYGYILTYSRL